MLKRLRAINESVFFIDTLDLKGLDKKVYLPFKELTAVKKKLLFVLNGSQKVHGPSIVPKMKQKPELIHPKLSVLISSYADIHLCDENETTIYFELPGAFPKESKNLSELFEKNKKLVPWFPAVLIGEDFEAAKAFLLSLKPKSIVTNNSGIAYEAYKNGIAWIAGPFMNITNSFSLLSLKENFNCSGAFISNELSKTQIRTIKKPVDFDLHFSIYHPVVLMTSRQCLFLQVTGCNKSTMDRTCITSCKKSASVHSQKGDEFLLRKEKGYYNTLYNPTNYLNSEIIDDFPNRFSYFLIDLRNMKTNTEIKVDKPELLRLFTDCLKLKPGASEKINQAIFPTVISQYRKGI